MTKEEIIKQVEYYISDPARWHNSNGKARIALSTMIEELITAPTAKPNVELPKGVKLCDCPECGAEIQYGLAQDVIDKFNKVFGTKCAKPNVSGELAKELLNGIIAADPNVINDYESGDFVIRSLYNQCQKLIKSLNSNDR